MSITQGNKTNLQKKNNKFIHVYMNPITYQEFRKKCPDYLFEVLEISNIKYSPKVCHNDFRDWHYFMVTTHIANTHLMYEVMKQFDCWKQEFRWNKIPPEPKIKKTPVAGPVVATDTIPNNGVDRTSLTIKTAEDIIGAKYDLWVNHHFLNDPYNIARYRNKEFAAELLSIKIMLELHEKYDGRKLAFIMYAISDCNDETLFLDQPRLHDYRSDDGTVPWGAYTMYGTFISYNPKSRQFEKYPRGWIKLGNGANFYNFYYTLKKNKDAILSVFDNTKQNTR